MTFSEDMIFMLFRILITVCMTLGMMITLTEFRFSLRKLLVIFSLYLIWTVFSSGIIIYLWGTDLLLRIFFVTVSIPAVFITYWVAKDTPSQAIFNYLSQIALSLFFMITNNLFTTYFGFSKWQDILFRLLLYLPTIYLEWRFLRRRFRNMVVILSSGWMILSLIPCTFCLVTIFLATWPKNYLNSSTQITYLYILAFLMIVIYIVIFKNLSIQYKTQMDKHNAILMSAQISSLENQIKNYHTLEKTMRIYKHDQHHKLHTIATLIERGETENALDFIGASQNQLSEIKSNKWCQNPILDAVLASYFEQAKQNDITVETHIILPEDLPVDVMELSLVFANALENAINACKALPIDQRKIILRCVNTPRIIFEISNPFSGEVQFGENHLPLSTQDGHGIGTQSIMAFVKKHNALCNYWVEDHWFYLQMTL